MNKFYNIGSLRNTAVPDESCCSESTITSSLSFPSIAPHWLISETNENMMTIMTGSLLYYLA